MFGTGRMQPARLGALLALCAAAFAAPAQQPADPATSPALRPIDEVLDEYVSQALYGNLALQRQELSVEQSLAALDEARGQYLPQASFESRFSRAEGGRTISLPLGNLLNPVYATLNELLASQGRTPAFGSVDNAEFLFLRDQEQQTGVRVVQPLYAPEITAGVRARKAQARTEEATLDTLARTLARDVRTAYHTWLRARHGLAIVDASEVLLQENLRVTESLFNNGKITRDQVLRAQAELLEVQQQRVSAANAQEVARSYFNFLLNRPLQSAIEEAAVRERPAALRPLADLQAQALEQRSELRELQSAADVAQAQVSLANARFKPTVALAVESGYQGEEYRFGTEDDYAIASLTFRWNIFNGNQDRARLSQARLAARSVGLQQEDARNRISLEVEQTEGDLRTAITALGTARARQDAAREGYKIAERKRDAGVISQVEFLDARTTLTRAELNYTVTVFDLLTREAELQYALGIPATMDSP